MNSELAELKAQCLKAKLRGFQMAHATALAKALSVEAGVQTPWNVSPQNLLNLIALVEYKRSVPFLTKAKPVPGTSDGVHQHSVEATLVSTSSVSEVKETQQAEKPIIVKRGRPKKNS